MPWVIWDILVPLLVTFLIGLGTGWLLWRWRRQRADIAQNPLVQTVVAEPDAIDSANTTLIRERDDALERASIAEAEIQSLKNEQELAMQSVQSIDTDSALVANGVEVTNAAESAEVESLTRELEQEKTSKGELERSLLDLNSRYKQLSARLEEAVNNEEAALLKQTAAADSEVERSREKLAEQQEALRLQAENEKQLNEKHARELAEKEVLLQQIQSDRDNLQTQLVNAYAANQNRTESTAETLPQAEIAVEHTSKVHQLSAYSAQKTSLVPGKHAVNRAGNNHGESGAAARSQPTASANEPSAVSDGSGGTVSMRSAPVNAVSAASAEPKTALETDPADAQAIEAPQQVAPQTARADVEESTSSKVTSISAANRKVSVAEQSTAAKVTEKSTSTGYIPKAWSVPDKAPLKAERDDLQEIKGVGPVLEKMLHKTGIWYFRQIALLDKQGVIELDDQLPQFSGRVQRDKWVKQAKALHKSKYGSSPVS